MKVMPEMCRAHFDFERTWWRWSQKCVVRTSNLSVPDEGYRRNVSCALRFWAYLMKVIPEMCRAHFDFERTGWRLSQKCVVRTSILRVTDGRLFQKCVVRTSILRVTDGRLFQKGVVRTKFDIYVFIYFYLYTFNPTILITPPKMMIY